LSRGARHLIRGKALAFRENPPIFSVKVSGLGRYLWGNLPHYEITYRILKNR
jgi:hypothetical protein